MTVPLRTTSPAPARPATGTERFLALHAARFVVHWQWHFLGEMLRATADTGETATISRAELEQLVEAGQVERLGAAGVRLTSKGKRNAAAT